MTRRVLLLALGVLAVAVAVRQAARNDGGSPDEPPASFAAHDPVADGRWESVMALDGAWRFRLGDSTAWARPDESGAPGWEPIAVPGAWEESGFYGYDGFAWYRTRFTLPPEALDRAGSRPLYLRLGRIDDADEVFLNGRFVGSTGRMPPAYETGFFAPRLYRIPPGYLDPGGENVLAIRVFDGELEGGILEGPLEVVAPAPDAPSAAPLVADLAGAWRLHVGDNPERAAGAFDDRDWPEVTVPARWDAQGLATHDGFAWYRKRFVLPADADTGGLVLVFGAIDDLDEAFVNGVRVGGTGDLERREVRGDEWLVLRAYPVPAGLLRPGENVVAVRVYDGLIDGGIIAGPVGLMRRADYADLRRRTERTEDERR